MSPWTCVPVTCPCNIHRRSAAICCLCSAGSCCSRAPDVTIQYSKNPPSIRPDAQTSPNPHPSLNVLRRWRNDGEVVHSFDRVCPVLRTRACTPAMTGLRERPPLVEKPRRRHKFYLCQLWRAKQMRATRCVPHLPAWRLASLDVQIPSEPPPRSMRAFCRSLKLQTTPGLMLCTAMNFIFKQTRQWISKASVKSLKAN